MCRVAVTYKIIISGRVYEIRTAVKMKPDDGLIEMEKQLIDICRKRHGLLVGFVPGIGQISL